MKSKKASKQDAGVPFRAWTQPPHAGCCCMALSHASTPLDSVNQDEPGADELKHVDVSGLAKPGGGIVNPTIGGKEDVASRGEWCCPMGCPGVQNLQRPDAR